MTWFCIFLEIIGPYSSQFWEKSCSCPHLDAFLLLGPFGLEKGLVFIRALDAEEAVGGVADAAGQHTVTQHGVDNRAFTITCSIINRGHLEHLWKWNTYLMQLVVKHKTHLPKKATFMCLRAKTSLIVESLPVYASIWSSCVLFAIFSSDSLLQVSVETRYKTVNKTHANINTTILSRATYKHY